MTHNPEADRQEALYEQAQEDGAAFMKLMDYLRGYARYDLDEIASEQSRYFLEDLEMCLHYIRKGEWTDREAVHTMGQHALAWLQESWITSRTTHPILTYTRSALTVMGL